MAANDTTRKQEANGERDPFSIFMFGNNKQRAADKEGEVLSGEEHLTSERGRHWADDWFWGNRGNRRNGDREENPSNYNQIENVLNSIDVELLMETIDMFVSTTQQLKPLFKEITPLVHQIRKKLKKP